MKPEIKETSITRHLILCTQYGTVEEEKGYPMYLNKSSWFDCGRPFIEMFLTVC